MTVLNDQMPSNTNGLRRIGEAIIKPVITTLSRATPNNHAPAIPYRSMTRSRRGCAAGCHRYPRVSRGVVFGPGADRVTVLIRATPDDELFA